MKSETEYSASVKKAISNTRKYYDSQCLLCGDMGERRQTDGAHIFPRDYRPYAAIGRKLAAVEYNIVSLCRKHHQILDTRKDGMDRKPWGRMRILRRHTADEFQPKLRSMLKSLYIYIENNLK
jgi:hypothetical protein